MKLPFLNLEEVCEEWRRFSERRTNELLGGTCYGCGSQDTAKMDVYFLQGETVCLLIIRRNKRKVKIRGLERSNGFLLTYNRQALRKKTYI